GERPAVGHACFEVTQLAFQVCLQPAAVLTLEGTQVVDPALELFPGLHQRAHGLTVPLLRVALQTLGPGPRVAGDLLGLAPRLGEDLVRLAAGTAARLVRPPASVPQRPGRRTPRQR